jgi:hypothetical protein
MRGDSRSDLEAPTETACHDQARGRPRAVPVDLRELVSAETRGGSTSSELKDTRQPSNDEARASATGEDEASLDDGEDGEALGI